MGIFERIKEKRAERRGIKKAYRAEYERYKSRAMPKIIRERAKKRAETDIRRQVYAPEIRRKQVKRMGKGFTKYYKKHRKRTTYVKARKPKVKVVVVGQRPQRPRSRPRAQSQPTNLFFDSPQSSRKKKRSRNPFV